MFVEKVGTITRPGTLVLLFLKQIIYIKKENECLTSVNMKRNQEIQR